MCTNPTKTIVDLMQVSEPMLEGFLSYENVLNTPNGQAAIAAYKAAEADVAAWTKGTPAQEVLQIVGDFTSAFATVIAPLVLKPADQALANVILGVIRTVIGVLTGNSPAPVVAGVAANAETQRQWEAHTIAETRAEVAVLVPNFNPSIWKSLLPGHSPADQAKKCWNETVAGNSLPASLKV